jgi:hypothetical protein
MCPPGQCIKEGRLTWQTDDVTAGGAPAIQSDWPSSGVITIVGLSGDTEDNLHLDPELVSAGAFGVVEIKIDDAFYATPPDFQVSFDARIETLKYYVVGTRYSQADINQLSVTDGGFTEEGRAEITFTKVTAGSFTASDILPDLLTDSSSKVVLFKSQAGVARSNQARKKIQLKKNGEVLIAHLPQPSADQATADQIISVAKP